MTDTPLPDDTIRISRKKQSEDDVFRIKRKEVGEGDVFRIKRGEKPWTEIGTFIWYSGTASSAWTQSPGNYAGAGITLSFSLYKELKIEGISGSWNFHLGEEGRFSATLGFKSEKEHIILGPGPDTIEGEEVTHDTAAVAENTWKGQSGIIQLGDDGILAVGFHDDPTTDNEGSLKFRISGR
jgi:hypothetical protein